KADQHKSREHRLLVRGARSALSACASRSQGAIRAQRDFRRNEPKPTLTTSPPRSGRRSRNSDARTTYGTRWGFLADESEASMGEDCGLSALQRDYKRAAKLTSSYGI